MEVLPGNFEMVEGDWETLDGVVGILEVAK